MQPPSQAQRLDLRTMSRVFAKALEKRLEALLKERYGEKASVDYISWDVRGNDRIVIDVDVDITKMLMEQRPELRKKSVEFQCGESLAEEPVCDEESNEFNEEECRKLFRECEEAEVKEFEDQNCDIGLKFAIARNWGMGLRMVSWLSSYMTDDLYYYYCVVEIRNRIELRKPEWIRSIDEWAKGEAEFLAWRILFIIGLFYELYDSL